MNAIAYGHHGGSGLLHLVAVAVLWSAVRRVVYAARGVVPVVIVVLAVIHLIRWRNRRA
jgi:hypothetical protein